MDVSIERILALKFLPIVEFSTVKNLDAFVESMLEQNVSILQVNFKTKQQIQDAHILKTLTQKYPEMRLGAGFVYSAEDARELINNGAQFLVSSVLAKEILDVSKLYHVPTILSGFTPTEIFEAHKVHSDLVQIFPAAQLHHKSIISILEHLPNVNFILTGGLTISTALEFLSYGAKAVGLKGALFSKTDLQEENYKEIGKSLYNFKERVQKV